MDFKDLIEKARAFAREHPDEFDKVAKDALPLVGNLLLGKFDAVEAEYDRREKAASVRAARELIREARREGAELDVFIQDVGQIVGLLLRSSVKSIL
jgi:hypothetical protein